MTEKYHIYIRRKKSDGESEGLDPAAYNKFKSLLGDIIDIGGDLFAPLPLAGDNPLVLRIIDSLQQLGVDFHNKTIVSGNPVSIYKSREYSPHELFKFEYCQVFHPDFLGKTSANREHDEVGAPYLEAPVTPRGRECGTISHTIGGRFLLVRGGVKRALERSGLKGLLLVKATTISRKLLTPNEEAWIVWSDTIMPKFNILCIFDSFQIRRFDSQLPHQSNAVYGGFLKPGDLHYRRDALAKVESFDVALTHERFGNRGTLENQLIYSRNFIQFFKDELNITLMSKPVHLDDSSQIPWEGPYPDMHDSLNIRPAWLGEFESK